MVEDSIDFREYRLLFLNEIERMNGTMISLQTVISDVVIDVSNLKVANKFMSSLWGDLARMVTTVIITLIIERMINR